MHWLPGCFLQAFLGIPCPGCGLTRSILAFFEGRLQDSVVQNWAGPLVVFLLLAMVVDRVRLQLKLSRLRWPDWFKKVFSVAVLGVLLAHWGYRLLDQLFGSIS